MGLLVAQYGKSNERSAFARIEWRAFRKTPRRAGETLLPVELQKGRQRMERARFPRHSHELACAVERRCIPAGANPARQLSLQPEAVGAVQGGNELD